MPRGALLQLGVGVLACLLARSADGQTPAQPRPSELRLSEFVAEVERDNPNVDVAQLRERAARIRIEPAGAWPDPFVAVGVDQVALGRVVAEDGSSRWPRPVIRYQLNQAFPVTRKLRARERVAESSADVLEADVDVLRRRLHVAAVQLFVQALYLQSALETNVRLTEALDDMIASAEARYATGAAAAHHDVLLATAQQAVLRRDALLIARRLQDLTAQMNELRGLDPDAEVPQLVDDGTLEAEALPTQAKALTEQPELHVADARVRAAESRLALARTAGYPEFAVQLMAMQSLTPGMPSGMGAMLGVTVPIYWKTKQGPGIDAAEVERDAQSRERDALRLRLETEWQAAERDYQTSLDTVSLYEKEVLPAVRAALESSQSAYVTQQARLSELLDVWRANLNVELEYAAAQLDVRLARLRMQELVSAPSIMRLAPASPTLFGGGMAGSMAGGMMRGSMGSSPVRMGEGMRPPTLDTGGGDGMSGMGGMR